ncbi:MAG: UDP-N-acetylmuramoyl-L-alanyl-D-glutamate--2,6-diaminopimelate ligase [Candidatus Binataceae bacterium]
MKLDELLAGSEAVRIAGDSGVEIAGLGYDSRRIRPGEIFFSLAQDPGQERVHIEDALNRGARAVVVRRMMDEMARPAVALVECGRPRHLMGAAAARFFAAPSERIDLIGVTGTSGKTTTTYLLASIFEAAGMPAGIVGTIGIFIRAEKIYRGLTTPESLDLESALARMEREGVCAAAAEVSSIGIAEGRVDDLSFRACLFTNLGRDHLDYHDTMENYFAAKLRLFTEILPRSHRHDPIAIVNAGDPYGRRVIEAAAVRKVSFGLERAFDAHPLRFDADRSGIRATLSVLGKTIEIVSPLIGEFNLLNILGASALSVALGIDAAAVAEGVRRCPGAPGRLEAVAAKPGVAIFVDYAHKPDALEGVLKTLRTICAGRLICVFGCGGDRDRGKRPIMGAIAGRLSDLPILTSDNPRTEEPLAIIAEVEEGIAAAGLLRIDHPEAVGPGQAPIPRGYVVEPDRRRAIALAMRIAAAGDVLIIAGKGHEDYQIVGNQTVPFDDRAVVREIAAEHTGQS